MSVRDIKLYYDEICQQYQDMLNEIHDFEIECEKGLIEPERLDNIKQTIQPLLNNYQTLSYIMFLLNKPVRKSSQKRYLGQNKKFLKQIDKQFTKEGLEAQNQAVISKLKDDLKV